MESKLEKAALELLEYRDKIAQQEEFINNNSGAIPSQPGNGILTTDFLLNFDLWTHKDTLLRKQLQELKDKLKNLESAVIDHLKPHEDCRLHIPFKNKKYEFLIEHLDKDGKRKIFDYGETYLKLSITPLQ